MFTPKRPRTADAGGESMPDDDESEQSSAKNLTHEDVDTLKQLVSIHSETLLSWLSNEKSTERKDKLRVAISDFCNAFSTISSAYLCKLAEENVVTSLKTSMYNACAKLDSATAAINSALNPARCSSAVPGLSYADTVSRASQASLIASKVTLQRGKPFSINKTERIVVGPQVDDPVLFPSSKETKAALISAINPVAVNLKVHRLTYGPRNTVVVEADSSNAEALAKCTDLAKAGLEVKPDLKLKPRLIIHDIPVDVSSDEILNSLIQQNVPNAAIDSVKIVFLYPAREKKHRSCVIETSAKIRSTLHDYGKVCIGWSRCRVDDHVVILQCFNCQGFGHKANECKNNTRCGICSGDHLSKFCNNKKSMKCVNCIASKLSNSTHTSFDFAKCPILRKKIDRKISHIDYGS